LPDTSSTAVGDPMKIQSDRYADAGIGENWVSASSAYRFEHDPCLPSHAEKKGDVWFCLRIDIAR
jgi:hypothetical protein